jgi:hypothetical protein
LIDVVDVGRGYTLIVAIDSSLDESGTVMSFEASDYALVVRLNMCGEVWLKIHNSNVLKVIGNNMA